MFAVKYCFDVMCLVGLSLLELGCMFGVSVINFGVRGAFVCLGAVDLTPVLVCLFYCGCLFGLCM